MQIFFEDKDLEQLLETGYNHKYRKYARNKKFMASLHFLFMTFKSVTDMGKLHQVSYFHYEKMKRVENRYSTRVMKGEIERVIFRKVDGGIAIEILELDNTHYGDEK